MLTTEDQSTIDDILNASTERYPVTLLNVFKGIEGFNLHKQMVYLNPELHESFTEDDKEKALIVVLIKTTISKATLKYPERNRPAERKEIMIILYIPDSESNTIVSRAAYSTAGKRWLKLMEENKHYAVI